jgi:hypothetical protein
VTGNAKQTNQQKEISAGLANSESEPPPLSFPIIPL